jgi:putative N6-adenine-specific DNA methylase
MQIRWLDFVPKGSTFAIDANVSNNPSLRHSLFAAQVVKDAICDQYRKLLGHRPNVDTKKPDVQINLFVHGQEGIISIDTSGQPLYKRGYRQESVEAPMQETLAAALLRMAKVKPEEIICDPCCGSGTFLIEAALAAARIPPGYLRSRWGFMLLPGFSNLEWLKVKAEADSLRRDLPSGQFFGCDINPEAVEAAKRNLRAAGFAKEIQIELSDFQVFEPKILPTIVITNPPHGKRLSDADSLKPLYRALGDFMKRKMAKPGRGFVFTANFDLSKEVGLSASKRNVIIQYNEECRFLEYDIYGQGYEGQT